LLQCNVFLIGVYWVETVLFLRCSVCWQTAQKSIYNVYFVYLNKNIVMAIRKNIDIDENVLTKVKLLSAFEEMSVKSIMEKAVSFYVEYKENERLKALSEEEKEDLGLLLLMQQADRNDVVSREELMQNLD